MSPSGSAADLLMIAGRGCCFLMPSLRRRQPSTSSASMLWIDSSSSSSEEEEEEWRRCCWLLRGSRGWKALGKLKAFLRRFRSRRGGGGGFRRRKFNYDPLSYALNFDEGARKHGSVDEDGWGRDFSARYASIPASLKLSVDLGTHRPGPYSGDRLS